MCFAPFVLSGGRESLMKANAMLNTKVKGYVRREPLLTMWLKDLQLLGAVYLARFIVWREIRHEHKRSEHEMRR